MNNKMLIKIEVLIEKLNILYEDIRKKEGNLTDIDRELLVNYSRELYELTQRVQVLSDKVIKTDFPFFEEKPKEIKNPTSTTQSPEQKESNQPGPKKTVSELFHSEIMSINERFKSAAKDIGDSVNDSPIRNLKTYISLNKRFIFVSRLFNDNSSEYDRAIDVCNSAPNEEEALRYLAENYSVKYNWKNEAEIVGDLSSFIHRRFI